MLEGVDAAGRGLDVDDGVREGDVLGEAMYRVRDRSFIVVCSRESMEKGEEGDKGMLEGVEVFLVLPFPSSFRWMEMKRGWMIRCF